MAEPRVALFTDTFDEVSGVGKTFTRLAEWSAARGRALDIFTTSADETRTEVHGSVRIHRIRPRVPFEYYPGLSFDLIPLDETALSFARDNEFDVVHVATPGHLGVTGLYLAYRQSVPAVGSYHTELPQYVSQRLVAQLDEDAQHDEDARAYLAAISERIAWDVLARFYDYCSLVLVPSEATRRSVATRLSAPLALFSRGVDAQHFRPDRRERPAAAPLRLLYVGRLAIEKNLTWLVEAAAAHPEWELVIVGDGPERTALAAALPHARFAGFLDGEPLAQEYADADLFAFPSLTETFGNVVLEAQASGLPAVVGHEGGPREIIVPERSGFVAHDAAEFRAHLETLAADPALRARFGRAARERAERQSWDEIFEDLWRRWAGAVYPQRRRLWIKYLHRLRTSDHPVTVALVAFWKQFGRRRRARRRPSQP